MQQLWLISPHILVWPKVTYIGRWSPAQRSKSLMGDTSIYRYVLYLTRRIAIICVTMYVTYIYIYGNKRMKNQGRSQISEQVLRLLLWWLAFGQRTSVQRANDEGCCQYLQLVVRIWTCPWSLASQGSPPVAEAREGQAV